MSRKRVPWDGPYPSPGEYLQTRTAETALLIRSVEPLARQDISGARLVLELVSVARDAIPFGSVIHPWPRFQTHELEGPARVRQVVSGSAAVMRATWRDPDDIRPTAARRAREITGWRAFCPLRRMAANRGSDITERQILAADHLRCLAEQALVGFSGRSMEAVTIGFGPRDGPTAAALAQAYACLDFARAMRRFDGRQRALITHVVLLCRPLAAWCAQAGQSLPGETRRLLDALARLEGHFASEVDRAIAGERLVRAA